MDEAYDQFVDIVKEGRGMDEALVRELADGRIYSAKQAKQNLLIDEIGTLEEEKREFTSEIGCNPDILFYAPEDEMGSFLGTLFGAIEEIVPKSDIDLATDILENKGNGVLKYYAK